MVYFRRPCAFSRLAPETLKRPLRILLRVFADQLDYDFHAAAVFAANDLFVLHCITKCPTRKSTGAAVGRVFRWEAVGRRPAIVSVNRLHITSDSSGFSGEFPIDMPPISAARIPQPESFRVSATHTIAKRSSSAHSRTVALLVAGRSCVRGVHIQRRVRSRTRPLRGTGTRSCPHRGTGHGLRSTCRCRRCRQRVCLLWHRHWDIWWRRVSSVCTSCSDPYLPLSPSADDNLAGVLSA